MSTETIENHGISDIQVDVSRNPQAAAEMGFRVLAKRDESLMVPAVRVELTTFRLQEALGAIAINENPHPARLARRRQTFQYSVTSYEIATFTFSNRGRYVHS